MGFVGVRSGESGASVRVSWTYLNISPRKHFSAAASRARAAGGEETTPDRSGGCCTPGWGRRPRQILLAAIIDFWCPVLIFKMKLFFSSLLEVAIDDFLSDMKESVLSAFLIFPVLHLSGACFSPVRVVNIFLNTLEKETHAHT